MIECFSVDKKLDIKDLDTFSGNVWIDVTNITKEESSFLKQKFSLHPLTIEDLYKAHVRVKIEDFGDYLISVFYSINQKMELTEMDFVLGKNFLITNHKKDLYKNFKNDTERIKKHMSKGLDFLFHRLLDVEIDNYLPILEKIDDMIEEIEETVTKNPKPEVLNKILKLKRTIINIKKITLPQREKISFLTKTEYKLISKKSLPYFRDLYDHAVLVSDSIDNYREAISNTFDVYMSSMSNSMNEVMKVLSIMATIALPLTVISGIYGTNFAILPGGNNPYGFWIMLLGMFGMMITMLLFFKRKNWF